VQKIPDLHCEPSQLVRPVTSPVLVRYYERGMLMHQAVAIQRDSDGISADACAWLLWRGNTVLT